MTTLVAILAGGKGRRIGGGKPLRRLGGERLIDRAIRKARSWSPDVRLSLRDPAQVPDRTVPIILDSASIEGPLAGLEAALQAGREAKHDYVLTIPCDAPFLPDDLHARLGGAMAGRDAAIAASGDDLHPVIALWRVEALDRLPEYLATGCRSLVGFAEAVGYSRALFPASELLNVNDERGLEEAQRRVSEVEHLDERARRDRFPPGT